MTRYIFIILLIFGFASCNKDGRIDVEIKEIIENEIQVFSNDDVPAGLTELYNESEILLFGETHFVQEHQEFIVNQLATLSSAGYRIIFEELFHGFTWIVEDYIAGEVVDLPEFLLYFNETLIEGVKQFNNSVADSLKFHIVYMDVNHWTTNFLQGIDEIEKVLGEQMVFSSIKNINTDSGSYKTNLQNLKNQIESDSGKYIATWGQNWFDRIINIIEGEIASSEFRINRSDEWRETVMFDNINRTIQSNPNKKYLINTGFFHGQKQTYMGTDMDRLGKKLKGIQDKTATIVFVGIKGSLKKRFNDETSTSFDLSRDTDSNDMIKVVDELAGGSMSFLLLKSEKFLTSKTKISYSSGTTLTAPIGNQFDAIITYPNVSSLNSMEKYDWN